MAEPAVSRRMTLVQVVSRSPRGLDSGSKLVDYFRLPSLEHILVIDPIRRVIAHHGRDGAPGIRTTVHHDGSWRLDPSGIEAAMAPASLSGAGLPPADSRAATLVAAGGTQPRPSRLIGYVNQATERSSHVQHRP